MRADRRWRELVAAGFDTRYDDVLADVHERDRRDTGRSDAPLLEAEDATRIDTSRLSVEEATAAAISAVNLARARVGG